MTGRDLHTCFDILENIIDFSQIERDANKPNKNLSESK